MNDDLWRFSDDLGPKQIAYLYEPSTGLRAIVVVDNVAGEQFPTLLKILKRRGRYV